MTTLQSQFEEGLKEYLKTPGANSTSYLRGWNNSSFKKGKVKIPIKENKKRAKMSAKLVMAIRKDAETMKQSEVCKKHGIKPGTCSGIVNRKTWRNI